MVNTRPGSAVPALAPVARWRGLDFDSLGAVCISTQLCRLSMQILTELHAFPRWVALTPWYTTPLTY